MITINIVHTLCIENFRSKLIYRFIDQTFTLLFIVFSFLNFLFKSAYEFIIFLHRKGCRLYPPHFLEYLALSEQSDPTLKIDIMFPDSSNIVGSFSSDFYRQVWSIVFVLMGTTITLEVNSNVYCGRGKLSSVQNFVHWFLHGVWNWSGFYRFLYDV